MARRSPDSVREKEGTSNLVFVLAFKPPLRSSISSSTSLDTRSFTANTHEAATIKVRVARQLIQYLRKPTAAGVTNLKPVTMQSARHQRVTTTARGPSRTPTTAKSDGQNDTSELLRPDADVPKRKPQYWSAAELGVDERGGACVLGHPRVFLCDASGKRNISNIKRG